MPQLMPLFWVFSSIMISYILLFMMELYYFVMNENTSVEIELEGEGVMNWWW